MILLFSLIFNFFKAPKTVIFKVYKQKTYINEYNQKDFMYLINKNKLGANIFKSKGCQKLRKGK